jgi:ABC-type lipopolysaccharide export system ATPase subunit
MTTTTSRSAIAPPGCAVLRRQGRARRHRPDVAEGSIFALLGPNGAGKTTAVQILSTLIGSDGGAGACRGP